MDEIKKLINKYLNEQLTNSKEIELFYQIGNIIKNNKINIKELELFLKNEYGVIIAFTERNLKNMVEFSNYQNIDEFKKITWKNILIIMKHGSQYIKTCLKYKPNKYELLDYIRNGKKLNINDTIEIDDMLEELLKLKEDLK